MKKLTCLLLFFSSSIVFAGFGPTKVIENAQVGKVYQGAGSTFVTFLGVSMPECSNHGGYLQPSWAESNGGVLNDAATARMLSVLLSAKTTGGKMQVRYKVNDSGTGWSNCAITGLSLIHI